MKGHIKNFFKNIYKRNPRRIIIGIDGAPYSLIRDLSEKDVMKNTKSLMDKGIFKQMESSIPEISSVAWSSIITGKNPAEHGIFGFTDIPVGTYRLSFPNFNNLKAKPFWMREDIGRSIIINVPSTFPVKSLNGIHISGFVSLGLERSVYPKSLIPKLNELNYQIDVDSSKAHKSIELFLNDLDKTLKARIDTYRYLWEKEIWQNFMLVFTGTDRLSHFLWNAYKDEDHIYHQVFLDHFRKIDEVIGKIYNRLYEEDLLILLSDHGFGLLEREVNINFLLRENGFLKLKPEAKRDFADIDYGTKAFALDPARIYVNLKNKYPKGSVDEKEYDKVIEELIDIFNNLKLEGKKVIRNIFRKEEIYHGPYMNQSPDLLLIPNSGFDLKANIGADKLYSKGIFTGKHTQHDAFLLVNHRFDKDIIPEKPSVYGICKIIEKFNNIIK